MTPVQGCRELRGCVVIAHCGSPCQELSHPQLFPVPSFPRIHGHTSSFCVCARAQSWDKLVTLVNFDEFSVWIRDDIRHDGYLKKYISRIDRVDFISRYYKYLSLSLPKCDLKCSFNPLNRGTLWSKILFYPKHFSLLGKVSAPRFFSLYIHIYFESDFDGDSREKYGVNMEQLNSIRDVAG